MEEECERKSKIADLMSKYLFGMGVFPNVIGYSNLIESIVRYSVADESERRNVGKIYRTIGEQCGKTGSSVEKSIKLLIRRCEQTGSMARLNEYFGYRVYWEDASLSASELVSLFAYKIDSEID